MDADKRRAFIDGYTADDNWTHEFALFDSMGDLIYAGRCENPFLHRESLTPMLRMAAKEMKVRPLGTDEWQALA
ncbi:hypothetical protein WK13_34640 [Burkholderia ubonensis]|nr:hypothetical protein WK13_34640 [Burkholderia ubonensis]